jgi:hypothetical protein
MSKRRTADPNPALETDACECAEQEITALLSPEQQKTIEQLKASVDGVYEASRRIGIYGSKILREINLSLIR